jgi:Fic family protein
VYRRQPTGYWAFIPCSLQPTPNVDLASLEPLLSNANLALGKLDGIGAIVPNPELFVQMYGRKEAVLSSQIEGTQASLSDVLEEESDIPVEATERPSDVREVLNYVSSLNKGLARLTDLPLSLRLIREIHEELMSGVRGRDKTPGEFRRTQNWIGPEGSTLNDAVFVPPPAPEMLESLADLERFVRADDNLPVLLRAGIAHAQFETIHPFLDGNGRLGRLLITFMLSERGVLSRPLLYLSFFFKQRKQEYYSRLMAVREEGDWEGWLQFFLTGVQSVSVQAASTARRVLDLQALERQRISIAFPNKANAARFLEMIYVKPTVTAKSVSRHLEVSIPTANTLVSEFARLKILDEVTGRERDRVFRHTAYYRVLTPPAEDALNN